MECERCSFRFFDVRLTPEEVDRLYSGYRGDGYFAARHREEPWYSRKVNDGIGQDPAEIIARNRALESFLGEHVDATRIDKVLDYGGDRGQFIPASIGRQKYVFELSDAVPAEGVTRLAKESDIAPGAFDLVMLCGVLEHCSDPAEILRTLRKFGATGSLLYIGVPYERYDVRFAGGGATYARYLDALLGVPPLLKLVDFYSAAARIRWDFIPPLGLVKCHEHLNFFNAQSITALLKRTGFSVLACEVKAIVTYPAKVESLCVLASLTS